MFLITLLIVTYTCAHPLCFLQAGIATQFTQILTQALTLLT